MPLPVLDFVCAAPGFHVHDRRSAVGSMACCALSMLDGVFSIRANGRPFAEPQGPLDGVTRAGLGARLRSALPEMLKSPLREAANEQHRRALFARLLALDPAPAAVFELYKYGSELGRLLAEERQVPLVLYYDAPEVVQYRDIAGRRPPSGRRAMERERATVRSAAAVIAYSEPVRRYLVDTHRCDPAKIHVFQTLDHSRMTTAEPPEPRDPPTIGYVGSFMHWHKLPELVQAFDLLRNGGTRARLLLVGSGMARPEVERRILRSPHRADIELAGFLDGTALAAKKGLIDIAVLPGTMWYNLPTKIFEYGAGSCATIAPDSPTVRSLFRDGEELLLFREGDPASIASALGSLARSTDLRLRLGRSLGERIKASHTSDAMRAFYRTLLAQVAGGGGRPSARR
jgi:glycosyltransferase involved in cell wall biosynthesis